MLIRFSRVRLRVGAALVVAAVTVLLAAVPAHASPPGPSGMAFGLVDYPKFMDSPPAVQSVWLSRAQQLGSTFVRLSANWYEIAPYTHPRGFDGANPRARGYDWASLDEDVEAAVDHHQNIVLMAWEAPNWAVGRKVPKGVSQGAWFPNAREFGSFGHALAVRYSGHFPDPLHRGRKLPRVRYFQAWNEPNLPNYIMPQWGRTSQGTWDPVSPNIYRSLLNAFYAGVKSAQPSSVVLSAGTAPYGDPPGTGYGRMRPVTFLQSLFCLTSQMRPMGCPDPPHLDALDHHPYSIGPTVKAHNGGDISVPDLDKIWAIVHAAQRYRHVLPAGPKSLWVTEIDWTSGGNDTPAIQAEDLPAAMYEFWRQDVTHVFWYELSDPPPSQRNSFLTAGLYYANGVPKPAAAAYRFPFAAVSVPHHAQIRALWGRAPATGRVSIQRLDGATWRQIASASTTSGGIFYTTRRLAKNVQLRAVIGSDASPTYITG